MFDDLSVLRDVVRRLADDSEEGLAADAGELAAVYTSTLRAARDAEAPSLPESLELGLLTLDALMDELFDPDDRDLMSPAAVREHPAWRAVRAQAQRLVDVFEHGA